MAQKLEHVFRISPGPHEYIDDRRVHDLLTAQAGSYLQHLQIMLGRVAAGEVQVEQPPTQIFTDPHSGGSFRVMSCVVRDGTQVTKTVKLVGTNLVGSLVPDQIKVGQAFRLDPQENFTTHTFDACLLSSAGSGACTALAAYFLAERCKRVVIVGAGRVGYYAGIFLGQLEGVRTILLRDLSSRRAEQTAAAIQRVLGPTVYCYGDHGASLPDCDVLVAATRSREPFLRPADVPANTVVSVGADSEAQRELTSDWARTADIYTDTVDSLRVGDLRAWLEADAIERGDVRPMTELMAEGPSTNGRSRHVFVSTGSALFDNLTIGYLAQQLARKSASEFARVHRKLRRAAAAG